MGRGHALSGAAAGLAAAPLLDLNLPETGLFALTTAAYALLPDLDHLRASATLALGPVGSLVSRGLRALSAWTYRATKGPRDENCDGTHRHLSHTVVFAVVLGALVVGLGTITPWSMLPVLAFGALVAGVALGRWARWATVVTAAPLVLAIVQGTTDQLTVASWQLGVAVSLGCVTHSLGDALTVSGCPFLWPLPIAGETWYEIRLLGPLSFRTGKTVETVLVTPLLVGLVAWGAWTNASPYLMYIQHYL